MSLNMVVRQNLWASVIINNIINSYGYRYIHQRYVNFINIPKIQFQYILLGAVFNYIVNCIVLLLCD